MDTLLRFAGLALAATLVYIAASIVYNLYFHPLAEFPGPLLRRISRVPWSLAVLRGTAVFDAADLHTQYGPVVRVAPNELAFHDPRAWKDIMGGGVSEIPKWIGMYGVPAFLPPHVQNTTSKDHHRTLRKALSPGFSDGSLRAQEPIIARYIDLLMRRLKAKSQHGPLNIELWYRYVVFDIICDLAFGESLGCLQSDGLHPWVAAMIDGAKPMGFLTALNMYPVLAAVVNPILAFLAKGPMRLNTEMVKPLVERRLRAGDRPDLINPLIKLHEGQPGEDSNTDELISNATVIIGAGAETSASILTAVTSLLIDHPEKSDKLAAEVRSAFTSRDSITADAVSRLPYLVACVDETLRLFPQTGAPSLRLTDKRTTIVGIPIPENTVVGIWPWALYRTPALWTDPDEFHPERFLGDPRYANDARESFKPFFTGSRDCIGQNLALIEMRLILAHMVFSFDMKRTVDSSTKGWVHKQKNLFIVWEKSPLPIELIPVA
ncbi:isotrichodermin C-15 hydroxylase [Xylaria bambusicola]|uniref:isotrichodermin C-15 hydroxylase n=1 Tax=Xylaria bambusicola TaxID=326684 RepID=UPI002007DF91|nr:isotrichodermin C-15 hydroxylase [Xylaria bambusicola]KAI0508905.1 isotrichodermin C-15 hydroxylase [Xylaria bambusicola]